MPKSYPETANRGPIPLTSLASPVAYSPPIGWVQVVSAGSGGLVVKDEGGIARTYSSLVAGQTLYGPFAELTSMTLTSMMAGDGQAPPQIVGASVSAADPRLLYHLSTIPLSATDGTLAEREFWRAPVACTVTGVFLEVNATMAASNTNYNTFTVARRTALVPGTPATVAASDTRAANLNGVTAWTEVSLGALTNTSLLPGDMLTFASVKTSAGIAAGDGTIRVTYSVP